jgi:hypothetical protein
MRLFRLAETLPAINWLQTVGSLEWQHPPWIFRGKHADLIQLPKLVLSEYEFGRREIILKLVEPFAPMMTEVTTGLAKSHAIERRAGLQPCAFAIGAITSRIFALTLRVIVSRIKEVDPVVN